MIWRFCLRRGNVCYPSYNNDICMQRVKQIKGWSLDLMTSRKWVYICLSGLPVLQSTYDKYYANQPYEYIYLCTIMSLSSCQKMDVMLYSYCNNYFFSYLSVVHPWWLHLPPSCVISTFAFNTLSSRVQNSVSGCNTREHRVRSISFPGSTARCSLEWAPAPDKS